MMRLLFFISILFFFASCKRGNRQVIELRNSSLENVYFLISENKVLSNLNEIARIRPIISRSIEEINIEYEDKEQAESTKNNLFQYRIERDSIAILLSSESAGIFINSITIKRIITDRFNGQLHVFIITEHDLQKHTDQQIINKKLYKHFGTLTPEDIKEDSLTLEYF